MTKERLVEILKEVTKDDNNITETMILDITNNIDIESMTTKEKAKYTIGIWDKVSPINGAPASYVLGQFPYTLPGWNGITYTVSEGEMVLILQQDDFTTQGWDPILTEERAFELANIQLTLKIEDAIVGSVLTKLRGE